MDNDKNLDLEGGVGPSAKEGDYATETASRARNRTVMLTPEITGQVRARLAQEGAPAATRQSGGFETPHSSQAAAGFVLPTSRAGAQTDTGEFHAVVESMSRIDSGAVRKGLAIAWSKETPVVGFLVSYDVNANGDIYELRSGRLMVTSQANSGSNCLVVLDDSVSPMHAIMRISKNGEIQILDQLSEFGTKIRRFGSKDEETLSGEKGSVEHGDVVIFGKRRFNVCIIAKSEAE